MTDPTTLARGMSEAVGDGCLTFEEFATLNGACVQGFGDAGNHRRGERHSDKTWARVLKVQRDKDAALYQRRADLKQEYTARVMSKRITPPTRRERLIAVAGGHPGLASVQAARRLVEKHFRGAGLGDDAALSRNHLQGLSE